MLVEENPQNCRCLRLDKTCMDVVVFMLLSNPFPLSVGRTCDLLLTNRIWQWCQNIHDHVYVVMLYKIVAPVLLESLCRWLCGNK